MFKLLHKSKYPTVQNALFSNRTYFNYLCTIYKSFQEKNFTSF